MTQEKLKPCPFCGSENIDPYGWISSAKAGPACQDCGGSADSNELWNTRTPDLEAIKKEAFEDWLRQALIRILHEKKETAIKQSPIELYAHVENIIGNIYPDLMSAWQDYQNQKKEGE